MPEKKTSPVESIKLKSDYLRGEIAEELTNEESSFGKASIQLLKHHGTYQQDNRDARGKGAGKAYSMMVRVRVPGGRMTSRQLLTQFDLCDQLGNSSLRLTSRQAIQFHGIPKTRLKELIQRINEVQLTTLAACGDVNRNVMCCPAPFESPIYDALHSLSDELAEHFAPRTGAYHEIWLQNGEGGEKELVGGGAVHDEIEPIYGKVYLPRKFKMGIALPHDNCIDIYTHDLGFLGVVQGEQLVGYNVLVGGGMGVTPSNKSTFPALAHRLAFVTSDQAIPVGEAVVRVQRDYGNRGNRKTARLKYLIHDWGMEKFREKVAEYYGGPLALPHETEVTDMHDHIGWEAQGNGRWYYGLNVENGRIADKDTVRLKAAVREICHQLDPGIRLTAHQSLGFADIAEADRSTLEGILERHGVIRSEQVSTVRRWSMACVALPTCGLAITDSERALPGIMDELEAALADLGLENEKFLVRMTGCPNGCARPYNCDIGLVGKAKGRYTMLLGGSTQGTRLNFIYKDLVPAGEIVPTLMPLLTYFQQERQPGESFGDFCHRQGSENLASHAQSKAG
jgi:sulfite reductase (ferredoxin)